MQKRLLPLLTAIAISFGAALPAVATTYTDRRGQVSFKIPSGWKNISRSADYAYFVTADGSVGILVRSLPASNLTSAVETAIGQAQQVIPDLKPTGGAKKITINGLPATTQLGTGTMKGVGSAAVNLVIVRTRPDSYLLFMSTIDRSVFDQGQEAVSYVIGSIRPKQ
ncbi:hypothetical protein [Gloeobacter kilaueensis]|uniref:PsbP C-terminal domain-containing protein n=1 Tax=Gloeobacter kilaueensis (strain ATCC BAA-2537 / CCAP 1431/1 / ULC 316 / JS1) TaxID=1183438 RepID=U5QKB6_GLOK1|nr:hypothetical protein [Gloeobacter kilaueensis]AGY59412.1 hypothetical protein GKIL_3166 [Gloeobacter kilaueensis JS1]